MTNVTVRVRDCACPHTPHADGDEIYLAPMIDLAGGVTAERQMLENQSDPDSLTRLLLDSFVRYGAKGWNLTDDDGAPLPFDVEEVLADYRLARRVAEKANDLYADTILEPFLPKPVKPSPTGRMAGTTSRRSTRTPTPSE